MNRFETISVYNDKIRELLKEEPALIPLQEEINNKLKNVLDKKERRRILEELMLNTWYKITEI